MALNHMEEGTLYTRDLFLTLHLLLNFWTTFRPFM